MSSAAPTPINHPRWYHGGGAGGGPPGGQGTATGGWYAGGAAGGPAVEPACGPVWTQNSTLPGPPASPDLASTREAAATRAAPASLAGD